MSFQYDFDAVKAAILFNTVEVIPSNIEELDKEIKFLVDNANSSGQKIRSYIGFEISGELHIGGGLFQLLKSAKLQQAGIEIVFWMADYHTWLNSKLDGKIETIKKVAREYFAPMILKTFEAVGGDANIAKIIFNYDDYRRLENENMFWDYEFQCDKQLTLNRVLRSLSITGKTAGDDVDYQLTRYPGMQAADVFWLQTHIAQSGLDQRKIYVSTRDIAYKIDLDFQLKIDNKPIKPICTFSVLLHGLLIPEVNKETGLMEVGKMSKSIPDSCVFGYDNLAEIQRKLKKAYCPMVKPEQTVGEIIEEQKFNPILNWCENLIFKADKVIEIIRPEKFGGNANYSTFANLKQDYFANKIHPMDLKDGVARCLAKWFEPIYNFAINEGKEGLELVKNAKK
jgi:tyrosyl-tRNA synthetase